ncbi:hypothetical protein ABVT39_010870 [Epinephelus coioides]
MDRKDNKREWIRLEQQVAREAELQQEAQEAERVVREEDRQEWAKQFRMLAGMFQEQATLMQDLINGLSVLAKQHSTPHRYRPPVTMHYCHSPPPPFPNFHTDPRQEMLTFSSGSSSARELLE